VKNIFYYVSTPAIMQICGKYGDRLQSLDNAQKFELIGFLGFWLSALERADEDEEIDWKEVDDLNITPYPEVSDILTILSSGNSESGHVADFITAVSCQIR